MPHSKGPSLPAKPLVSVQIPCWSSSYLEYALDSVLAQSDPRWELIVLVDGPPEREGRRIRKVLDRYRGDARVRPYFQANLGTDRTVRRMFGMTECPYIVCLDDDNMLFPSALREVITYFKRFPRTPLVKAGVVSLKCEGGLTPFILEAGQRTSFKPPAAGSMLPDFEQGMPGFYAFQRRFLRKAKPMRSYREFFWGGADIDFLLKMEEIGPTGWISKRLSVYRFHKHNQSDRLIRLNLGEKLVRRYLNSALRRRKPSLSPAAFRSIKERLRAVFRAAKNTTSRGND